MSWINGINPGFETGRWWPRWKSNQAVLLIIELKSKWQQPIVRVWWVCGDMNFYQPDSASLWTPAEFVLFPLCGLNPTCEWKYLLLFLENLYKWVNQQWRLAGGSGTVWKASLAGLAALWHRWAVIGSLIDYYYPGGNNVAIVWKKRQLLFILLIIPPFKQNTHFKTQTTVFSVCWRHFKAFSQLPPFIPNI